MGTSLIHLPLQMLLGLFCVASQPLLWSIEVFSEVSCLAGVFPGGVASSGNGSECPMGAICIAFFISQKKPAVFPYEVQASLEFILYPDWLETHGRLPAWPSLWAIMSALKLYSCIYWEENLCFPWCLCGCQRRCCEVGFQGLVWVICLAPIVIEPVSGPVLKNLRYSIKKNIHLDTCLLFYLILFLFDCGLFSFHIDSSLPEGLHSLALVLRAAENWQILQSVKTLSGPQAPSHWDTGLG